MSSNRSSDLNPKQEELVKKLENIRQQRQRQNSESKEQQGRSAPKKPKRRNEQQQKESPKRRTPIEQSVEKSVGFEQSHTRHRTTSNQKKRMNKKTHKQKKQKIVQQLTDSDNLAQAMILNEILSKPVALRSQNR